MFRIVSIRSLRLNFYQMVIEINSSISESKVKFMEKIGVKSKQMRRRSVGGLNLREKSASYPNCHSIRNDASIIEIGKHKDLVIKTILDDIDLEFESHRNQLFYWYFRYWIKIGRFDVVIARRNFSKTFPKFSEKRTFWRKLGFLDGCRFVPKSRYNSSKIHLFQILSTWCSLWGKSRALNNYTV